MKKICKILLKVFLSLVVLILIVFLLWILQYFHKSNPKNRITGDCTFRAICTALEKDWKDTVMEMAEFSCQTGYAINDDKGIMKYLEKNGWIKMKQPKKINGTKIIKQIRPIFVKI